MSIISVDQISARLSGAAVTVSDRFDVSGGNIQLDGGTGVITATSFKGSGANLTGIAVTSDINTNNIKVSGISTFGSGASTFPGAVSVTNTTTSTSTSTGALIVSGGVGIAKSLFVGENVSIGGTLTYEDVTNIDSVGVVTARTGIKVLAGGINAVGVVTATTIHVGSATTIDGSGINVTGIVTAQTFVPTVGQLSHRNLMINGAMQVAQRGTSTTTTGDYTADRYRLTFAGTDEAPTMTQHALTSSDTGPWAAGFRYSTHITNGNQTSGAGAADSVFMKYKFEAQDIAQSGWDYNSTSSYVTLSFWVKASVAQNYYGYTVTDDGTQQNFPFETGSLTADTWKKVTVKIPGNSNITMTNDATNGMAVHLLAFLGTDQTASGVSVNTWAEFASGTRTPDNTSTWYTTNDATFEFTGFQLEVGSVATPFEHRSYAEDLVKCQRYYYKLVCDNNEFFPVIGMADVDGNTIVLNTPFSVVMRDAPSAVEQTGTASDYKIRRSTTATCTSVPAFVHATVNQAATNFVKSSHGFADGSCVRCMGGATGAFLAWSAEL